MKSKVDKLDIGKLETTPVDLSKLNDVVKNEVVKKTIITTIIIIIITTIIITTIITTDTSNLVKNNCNTRNNEIEEEITYPDHDKYITIQEFNKLTSENFAAKLKQANLACKTDTPDITGFVKKSYKI